MQNELVNDLHLGIGIKNDPLILSKNKHTRTGLRQTWTATGTPFQALPGRIVGPYGGNTQVTIACGTYRRGSPI
eukprot:12896008-Prorocentrum_lima.AAC.1